jgi:hypothetical protein
MAFHGRWYGTIVFPNSRERLQLLSMVLSMVFSIKKSGQSIRLRLPKAKSKAEADVDTDGSPTTLPG